MGLEAEGAHVPLHHVRRRDRVLCHRVDRVRPARCSTAPLRAPVARPLVRIQVARLPVGPAVHAAVEFAQAEPAHLVRVRVGVRIRVRIRVRVRVRARVRPKAVGTESAATAAL